MRSGTGRLRQRLNVGDRDLERDDAVGGVRDGDGGDVRRDSLVVARRVSNSSSALAAAAERAASVRATASAAGSRFIAVSLLRRSMDAFAQRPFKGPVAHSPGANEASLLRGSLTLRRAATRWAETPRPDAGATLSEVASRAYVPRP